MQAMVSIRSFAELNCQDHYSPRLLQLCVELSVLAYATLSSRANICVRGFLPPIMGEVENLLTLALSFRLFSWAHCTESQFQQDIFLCSTNECGICLVRTRQTRALGHTSPFVRLNKRIVLWQDWLSCTCSGNYPSAVPDPLLAEWKVHRESEGSERSVRLKLAVHRAWTVGNGGDSRASFLLRRTLCSDLPISLERVVLPYCVKGASSLRSRCQVMTIWEEHFYKVKLKWESQESDISTRFVGLIEMARAECLGRQLRKTAPVAPCGYGLQTSAVIGLSVTRKVSTPNQSFRYS